MDDTSLLLLFGLGGSMILAVVSIVIIIIVIATSKKDTIGSVEQPAGSSGSGTLIPLTEYPLKKGTAPWYAIDGGDSSISYVDGALRIRLKKNATGGGSGGSFKANPFKSFPSEQVTFSYMVRFPDDFDWVKGGKLPGVCWGDSATNCSTGGNWSKSSGSFRLMWRENGQAIGYAYLATTADSPSAGNTAMKDQGPVFVRSVHLNDTNKSGLDMWFKGEDSILQFKKGWNTVSMTLKMNTPGTKNGSMSLTVNGKTKTVNDAHMRLSKNVTFNLVNIVSFRGGNGKEWESGKDTSLDFKDFRISTK